MIDAVAEPTIALFLMFPVRFPPKARNEPARRALDVPRPDASKIAGTRNGSHPKDRNRVKDAHRR